MKEKVLTEAELDERYHRRAAILVGLIGRYYGSGNKKRTQRGNYWSYTLTSR